ncbi:MAG: hypothetical protein GY866_07925 [Proteobacteria bacterium]|nr:hypothetical protein [Pseudomonadota bacterium]
MFPYHKIAEICGGFAACVTDPKEIVPTLQKAAATGQPSIVNIQVNKEDMCPATIGFKV